MPLVNAGLMHVDADDALFIVRKERICTTEIEYVA